MYKVGFGQDARKEIIIADELPPVCKSFGDPINAARYACSLQKEHKNYQFVVMRKEQIVLKTKLQYKVLNWADEEYRRLSKCKYCYKAFSGEGYNNKFSNGNVFCSIDCANEEMEAQVQKLTEDDSEFYC